MRETRLERAGDRRVMRTDDGGTVVLRADGTVAAEHGTDMHETLLDELGGEGWEVASDDDLPPTPGLQAPGQDPAAPGIHATGNDAESG